MLIAVDHPARNAFGVRGSPMAMESREDLLARVVAALGRPGVDGVLGSPDIVEDLLLLGALEGKVVIGSMNRGGLQGSVFEFDDRLTGYDAETIAQMGYNGGKVLTRVALDDPGTVATLVTSAEAVSGLARSGLMAMVEPFFSRWVDGRAVNDLSAEGVIRSLAVCSALGPTSAYTWLKLPVVADMERVMAATTLPTLAAGWRSDRAAGGDLWPVAASADACPACAVWSSAARCSTHRTTTSRRRSTSRPAWCGAPAASPNPALLERCWWRAAEADRAGVCPEDGVSAVRAAIVRIISDARKIGAHERAPHPPPGQGHRGRTQLPRPRRRVGQPPARVADPVRQVVHLPGAGRCSRGAARRCGPGRLRGRAGRRHRPAGSSGARPTTRSTSSRATWRSTTSATARRR